ncbi:putative disease resistance protein RGA3 [Mangifera indica]|uniref:putative disease resistance protein RGA3 n=1 Tax=Mangifera indica TaxID=29780 RepID=UPI001CFB28F1|nr:putative disease resistance protein RGA3 [Mangifera indica]
MAEEIAISTAAGLASNATESGYFLLKRQISYVFKYRSYINDLKKQVEDLRNKRETVEKPVESAERQGEEIYKAVKKWLSDVDEFTERVEKAITEDEDKANKGGCFKLGSYPNLIQRYKLGKQAMKAQMDGADMLGKGNFSSVSYRPALQRTESMYVRDYETFDSRQQAFQEIMEALLDVNINMIGVYGMGGVGKTTLVKKVAWEAKKNKFFDEVVIAEATQTPDYKRIQEKVASELGLEFRQQDEYQRTDLLRNRIRKEKNLLIILDNVWTKLDLDAIGIPFKGVEGENDEKIRPCTILLTSRNRDLLSKDMKTQKDIFIGPLSYGDALNLFCKIVGGVAKSSDFRSVTVEIVRKCAGLPVAISTIANALKNESLHAWKDVLAQLKRSNPTHILDMDETLYSTIELSYKFLKNEEAKSLFLLCALYNAGDSVFIDDLLKCSMGWSLFGDVYTLEEGRNRLHRLIDHLKASCLLLDGTYDNSVKMHDIIHAVAVSIASMEKLMFNIQNVIGLEEVLGEKISKDSIAISLPDRNINYDLPERLEYPKLKLFFLFAINRSPQIPNAFFKEVKELRVLSLSGLQFLPLPSSISFLKSLKTLLLKFCILEDLRILGELSKLEILSLAGSNFKEFPAEIRQLTRLKLLDLSNCSNLKYIATNVISSLSQLQELYMGNSFVQWEVEGVDNQGRRNASLEELKRLSNLTALHLHIQDARVMPQDLFFKKLKSYKIFIGDKWKWPIKFDLSTSRMLKLMIDDSIHLQHGVRSLLKMTEDLSLKGMSGVRNVIYELNVDGFPHLKHLHIKDDLELLYIINSVTWKLVLPNLESLILGNLIKLENICHGQLNVGSFRNLRIIKIEKCDRLEYLFVYFIVKNLVQLEEIEVTDCKNLKEIFGEENNDPGDEIETNNKTEFNQLCSLTLQRLPKFIKICFDMRVVFPRLENLKVCSINFENTCIDEPLAMFHYSQCLKSLTVEECNDLKFLFSSSMVKSLNQLQKLLISNCKSMEVITDPEGVQNEEKIVDMSFPRLLYLKLEVLPKLTSFCVGNLIEFPSLKELHIERCSNLKTFFYKSFYPEIEREPKEEANSENNFIDIYPLFDEKVAFPSLEKMVLLHLDNLQLIWYNQKLYMESFCKLKVVRVESCEKLLTIVPCNTQGHFTLHNLERLIVKNCKSMKSLFPVSTATGLVQLKKLQINSCGLEKIVSEEEVNGAPIFLFPQLTWIHLENLQELKCFYPRLHAVEWPMLRSLGVYKCKNINLYASEFPSFQARDRERQPALFFLEKIIPNLEELALEAHDFKLTFLHSEIVESFGKLKILWLANFDDEFVASLFDFLQKLNCLESLGFFDNSFKELFPYEQGHIWKQDFLGNTFLPNLQRLQVRRCHRLTMLMPSAMSFKNLETLEVYNCNGLAKVLTSEATKTLVNLTTMRIRECKLLIEIMANEGDKEEEIVFGQLKVLELHCLSSLAFFCSTNYSFKFPYLGQVIVSQCPKLNIFSQGALSTPLLEKVQLTESDDDVECFWKDDLNSTIQQIFTDMIGFHNMEYVKLSEFPTLKEKILNEGLPVSLFCNLKWLVLDEDFDKSTAFPFHVFNDLRNLETLEVRNYHSLEDLFDIKGKTVKNSKEEILGFNNLKSLKVHGCSSLRYIFTPAIILGLDQLQEIEVKNCALVEIIIKDEGKEGAIDKIFIPYLSSIVLELLPDLTNFYSGTNYLECPSLKSITITNCPKMETFVFSNLKTEFLIMMHPFR